MTNNIEVLRGLLREAVPYLRDAGEPFEDDGGNEPLELSRRIEDALESDAALAALGGEQAKAQQPEAVAWAVADASGKIGRLGWLPMQHYESAKKLLTLSEGARFVFAYYPTTQGADHDH